jgi:hypothetical protein
VATETHKARQSQPFLDFDSKEYDDFSFAAIKIKDLKEIFVKDVKVNKMTESEAYNMGD